MKVKSLVRASLLSVAVVTASAAFAANDPTIQQVYQAAEAGKYDQAQAMMDKVLADHPNSGKAHFVEGELLAKQGKLSAARAELNEAERLAPGLPFAKPGAAQALRDRIAEPRMHTQAAVQPYPMQAPVRASGGGLGMVLIGFALLALLLFGVRAFMRRNQTTVYAPGAGYGPSASSPYYGGQPGPGYGPAAGGGIGSGIMGGLATGVAVGAGIAAGEALVHHFTDSGSANAAPLNYAPDPNLQAIDDERYDMGGNDFGVSGSDSWDDGSNSIGGDDW